MRSRAFSKSACLAAALAVVAATAISNAANAQTTADGAQKAADAAAKAAKDAQKQADQAVNLLLREAADHTDDDGHDEEPGGSLVEVPLARCV